jgi:hypothetical protein
VKPILQEIHNRPTPNPDNLPQIWWIGVGIANFPLFHATSDHSIGSADNTFSWAVSSYTLTIKALAYTREQGPTTAKFTSDKPKHLIVTMPTTPSENPLPGVTKEMLEVKMAVKSVFLDKALIQPNARMVLDQLRRCDMVLLNLGHMTTCRRCRPHLVLNPPRTDPHYLFLTLFYLLYSSLYPLPRQQHTYHGGRPRRQSRQTAPI